MGSSVDWCRRVGQSITHPFIHSFIQSIGPPLLFCGREPTGTNRLERRPFPPPSEEQTQQRPVPTLCPTLPSSSCLAASLTVSTSTQAGRAGRSGKALARSPSNRPTTIHPSSSPPSPLLTEQSARSPLTLAKGKPEPWSRVWPPSSLSPKSTHPRWLPETRHCPSSTNSVICVVLTLVGWVRRVRDRQAGRQAGRPRDLVPAVAWHGMGHWGMAAVPSQVPSGRGLVSRSLARLVSPMPFPDAPPRPVRAPWLAHPALIPGWPRPHAPLSTSSSGAASAPEPWDACAACACLPAILR